MRIRTWLAESKWYVTYPLVLAALTLAVVIGSCGSSDDSCEYDFVNVLTQDECDDLAAGFGCNSVQYSAGEELCATAGCICAAFDCEYEFTNVGSETECVLLAEQLFCDSAEYNAEDEICDTAGCICGDVDLDTDLDSDIDL